MGYINNVNIIKGYHPVWQQNNLTITAGFVDHYTSNKLNLGNIGGILLRTILGEEIKSKAESEYEKYKQKNEEEK